MRPNYLPAFDAKQIHINYNRSWEAIWSRNVSDFLKDYDLFSSKVHSAINHRPSGVFIEGTNILKRVVMRLIPFAQKPRFIPTVCKIPFVSVKYVFLSFIHKKTHHYYCK